MAKKSNHKLARKLLVVAVLLCLVAGIGYGARSRLMITEPRLSPNLSYHLATSAATTPLAWPAVGQAAIGAQNYGVLATGGSQTPAPTASVAKLITILAVLRVKPLAVGQQGPTITLTQADVDSYNEYNAEQGSVVPVTVGEQISEYQVIQAMLLPSANNMADTLATWAFGSLSNYATYANKMLASLKLSHTHVGSDASGFLPDTTSTASDLVGLGMFAAADPIISSVADEQTAALPNSDTVRNVNWLLGNNGINGLKTGNSDQAGGVFLFSAPYTVSSGHTITIIGAVMQASNLASALTSALPLLSSAQKNFTFTTAITSGQVVGSYNVPWGKPVSAVSTQDTRALYWQGKPLDKPTISLATVSAPLQQGAAVGSISVDGSRSTIKLAQPVTQPSIWWRLTHKL